MFKTFLLTVEKHSTFKINEQILQNPSVYFDQEKLKFADGITLYIEPFERYKDSRVIFYSSDCLQLLNGCLFDSDGKSFTQNFASKPMNIQMDSLGKLRGSFCGFTVNLERKYLCGFTDHLGCKPLYYYEDDELFLLGSSVFAIAKFLRSCHCLKVSLFGAYSLLTYGYMLGSNTLFYGIKRLTPGTIIDFDLKQNDIKSQMRSFYKIDFEPYDVSYAEAVDNIDDLFLQAVKRQAQYNSEQGLHNLCALSGGLDSRMTAFALERCGINDVLYYTYSQSGRDDCVIPQTISSDKKWEWLLLTLDKGSYLLNIDDAIKISDGTNYYGWAAQLASFLNTINTSAFGLVHTGVLGDVVVGSFVHRSVYKRHQEYIIGDGAYSRKLISKLVKYLPYDLSYNSYEEGMMVNRALNGAYLGYAQSYARCIEAYSPFMDVDFFSYCMHIPMEMRMGHKLYYRWVLDRFSEAAKYKVNGRRITANQLEVKVDGTPIPLRLIPEMLCNKLKDAQALSMNPVDQWWAENQLLRNTFDSYFYSRVDLLSFNHILQNDTIQLYETGTTLEKTQCLSLVGSLAYIGM